MTTGSPGHHNGEVRIRLTLIAAALAVLALAGLRGDDARANEAAHVAVATTHLVAQPAPDVDPPAIVRAAVATPSGPQTLAAIDARGGARPVPGPLAAATQTPADPAYDVSRPRTFPLLI